MAVQHAYLYGRHHPYACQSKVADLSTGEGFAQRKELRVLSEYYHSQGIPIIADDDVHDDANGDTSEIPHCLGGISNRKSTTSSASSASSASSDCAITDNGASEPLTAYHGSLTEVTLYSGDVLMIPPFWLHEVGARAPLWNSLLSICSFIKCDNFFL